MNIGARHAALAAIGESELAAAGQGLRRGPSLRFVARDDFVTREKRILLAAFSRRAGRMAGFGWLLGPNLLGEIADRERRRMESSAGEWFLYGVHMLCYHISIWMSTQCLLVGYSNKRKVAFIRRENLGSPDGLDLKGAGASAWGHRSYKKPP